MGDAEFAGGGSVDWTVTNSDPESGSPKQSKGKDKDPKNGGSFAILVNGRLVATPPATRGNTIKIYWGPDAEPYLSGTTETTQAPPRSK
jgi:hypothetical protein